MVCESDVGVTGMVELPWDEDLDAVLRVMGVKVKVRGARTAEGPVLLVEMDDGADGRLEDLVNLLSKVRWLYDKGRRMQLELWAGGWDDGVG